MYWSSKHIQRANLDGSNVETLVRNAYGDGIALDVAGGKMYWTAFLTIRRANLDGSNVEDLVTELDAPAHIALDVAGGKMYWAEEDTGKIRRANLDGSNVEDIVTGLREPVGIALGTTSPGVFNLDVTEDGSITHLDIIEVGKNYGRTVADGANLRADVNNDGKVDIHDLIAVAKAVDAAAAPSLIQQLPPLPFTAQELERWIREAKFQNLNARGIKVLKHFLEALTQSALLPKEIALLPNYPNPFNPETWIPYHLSTDAEVQLTIYDINGMLVRELDLGYQQAGYYTDRSRAAYWGGRNEWGERVASGIYFYQLRADGYSQMRKMVIVK